MMNKRLLPVAAFLVVLAASACNGITRTATVCDEYIDEIRAIGADVPSAFDEMDGLLDRAIDDMERGTPGADVMTAYRADFHERADAIAGHGERLLSVMPPPPAAVFHAAMREYANDLISGVALAREGWDHDDDRLRAGSAILAGASDKLPSWEALHERCAASP